MTKDLTWGETAWDDWDADALRREVRRMYAALEQARSVMSTYQMRDEGHPYWGSEGVGGRAIAMAQQVLAPYEALADSMYRTFYRYAVGLMFDGVGRKWRVCPNDHMMTTIFGDTSDCTLCRQAGRGSVPVRALTWDDMKPKGG